MAAEIGTVPLTRAIPIVVQRSPGGGNGWRLSAADAKAFWFGGDEHLACAWVDGALTVLGADTDEIKRVTLLVRRELGRTRRAEVTAEVSL